MHPLDVRDQVICIGTAVLVSDPDLYAEVRAEHPALGFLASRRRFCQWVRRNRDQANVLLSDLERAERIARDASPAEHVDTAYT